VGDGVSHVIKWMVLDRNFVLILRSCTIQVHVEIIFRTECTVCSGIPEEFA
jgi:hypothetical protein